MSSPSTTPVAPETVTPSPATVSLPMPWPLFLSLATPLLGAALLAVLWNQAEYFQLMRAGWILVTCVLPGLSLMSLIGGALQMGKRPAAGGFACLLSIATLGLSLWAFFLLSNYAAEYLK